MDMASVGELAVLSGGAVAVALIMFREARCAWQWKRSVGRLDRGEWTKLVRALRDNPSPGEASVGSGTDLRM